MWFVYILLCEDNSLYTGISDDPERRFLEHKNGIGGRYTRSHKVMKLLYTEKVSSKSEALKREIQIKGWSRKKKMKSCIAKNVGQSGLPRSKMERTD